MKLFLNLVHVVLQTSSLWPMNVIAFDRRQILPTPLGLNKLTRFCDSIPIPTKKTKRSGFAPGTIAAQFTRAWM